MAVPKSRISKSARRMRRSHLKISARSVNICKNCNNSNLPHRVCIHCGFYNGKMVISVKSGKE